MGWLDGQVGLVTGGGSGIGRAVVARFIDEGARVGVLDRVAARAEELRAEFGAAVVAVTGDVTQLEDNKRAVGETVGAFGRLDIFVGNAGVFDNYLSLADFPEQDLSAAYDELFGVNVKGCVFGAKAALPELLKTDGSMVFHHRGRLELWRRRPLYTRFEARCGRLDPPAGSRAGPSHPGERCQPGAMTDLRGCRCFARTTSAVQVCRSQREGGCGPIIRCRSCWRPAISPGSHVFCLQADERRGITGTILTVDARATLRMRAANPSRGRRRG